MQFYHSLPVLCRCFLRTWFSHLCMFLRCINLGQFYVPNPPLVNVAVFTHRFIPPSSYFSDFVFTSKTSCTSSQNMFLRLAVQNLLLLLLDDEVWKVTLHQNILRIFFIFLTLSNIVEKCVKIWFVSPSVCMCSNRVNIVRMPCNWHIIMKFFICSALKMKCSVFIVHLQVYSKGFNCNMINRKNLRCIFFMMLHYLKYSQIDILYWSSLQKAYCSIWFS